MDPPEAAAVDASLGEEDCVGVGDGDDGGDDDGGADDVGLVGEVAVCVGEGDDEEEYLDVGAGDEDDLWFVGPDADPRGVGSRPGPGLPFAFEPLRLAPPAEPASPARDVPPVDEPPAVGPPGVTALLCWWPTTCEIALNAAYPTPPTAAGASNRPAIRADDSSSFRPDGVAVGCTGKPSGPRCSACALTASR